VRTITRKQDQPENPLPFKSFGRGHQSEYDLKDLFDWHRREVLSEVEFTDEGVGYSYDVEKARLTHHQANKTELETKVLKGKLLYAEEVEQDLISMLAELRSKLLGLPMRLAQVAITATSLKDIESACTNEIHRLLDELTSNAQRYQTADFVESVGDTEAPAETLCQ
jgi:phage terminase Nu1 subunit (DNA packaging protein)